MLKGVGAKVAIGNTTGVLIFNLSIGDSVSLLAIRIGDRVFLVPLMVTQ